MSALPIGSDIEPAEDIAAADVLAAYEAAERAGYDTVECYCAGVDAWKRSHPDQTPTYAARQAVTIILAAKITLRSCIMRKPFRRYGHERGLPGRATDQV